MLTWILLIGLLASFLAVFYFLVCKAVIHYKILLHTKLTLVKKLLYIVNPFSLALPKNIGSIIPSELISKGTKCIIAWILSLVVFYIFLYFFVSFGI